MDKDCLIGCNVSEKFKQSTYPWVQKATGVGQKMSYILLHQRRKQENFVVFFLVGGGDTNLLFGVGNSHETDRMEMCVEAQKSWVEKPLNLFLPLCINLSLQYLQRFLSQNKVHICSSNA